MTALPTTDAPAASSAKLVRSLAKRPLAAASFSFIILIVAAAIAAPIIAPYNPLAPDLQHKLLGPGADHLLGTDSLGRDVLSRLLYGARPTLAECGQTIAVALAVGVTAGLVSGYIGKLTDAVISRAIDVLLSVPAFIILLVVLTISPQDMFVPTVTLGVLFSPGIARVIRSAVLGVRSELYIDAAKVSGLRAGTIIWTEVLPRCAGPIIVQASLTSGAALLTITGLGFLGFGGQPPAPTWGSMIADGNSVIQQQSWLLVPTGAVVALSVLAFGVLGDAVRDALSDRWTGASDQRGWAEPSETGTRAERPAAASPVDAAARDLLEVHDLSVSFPRGDGALEVVRGVNFAVRTGEAVGIVGESGCGKSVTMRAVLGLLRSHGRVTSGSILFEGRDLARMRPSERARYRGTSIGFIPQEPLAALDPICSIGQLLTSAVRKHDGCGRRQARERAVELLRLVQLRDPEAVLKRYPFEISGGMAQRVLIALALVGRPKLLIADEPTTALDVTVQAEILDLLRSLREQLGMALVLVTHDWGVVADSCDRVVVMYAGEVVEEADAGEILARPMHPYTAALLASNPQRVGHGLDRLPTIPGSVMAPADWPRGCHFAPRCKLAVAACGLGDIPTEEVGRGHSSKCIRTAELELTSREAASERTV